MSTTTPDNQKTIVEGSAKMSYPADQESTVFYNPVQVQNRDLSVLMITLAAERRAVRKAVQAKRQELKQQGGVSGKELKEQVLEYEKTLDPTKVLADQDTATEGLTILDALAASGLRSIRYWKEIPGVKHITINDLDPAPVERAHTNIQVNELKGSLVDKNDDRLHGIRVQNGDAKHELYLSRRPQNLRVKDDIMAQLKPQWDIIDLDPYGSAAPFLDAAIQGIESGGMLNVTCTDMAALGGSHPETCYGRYASMPIQRAGYLQELAVRILLQSIASTAARYGRTMRPILSVGMNFYVRVFVEIRDDKAGVNELALKCGHVYQSTQCSSFHIVPNGQLGGKKNNVYQAGRAPPILKCEETGGPLKIGGPLWLGPMHDTDVIRIALQRLSSKDETVSPAMKWIATRDRLRGLLTSCHEELPDAPLFYKPQDMAQQLGAMSPKLADMKAALINAGYQVSGYHKEPQAIKTNAPNRIVWDVLRAWCKKNPPKKKAKEGSTAEKILEIEPSIEVDFSVPRSMKLKKDSVARFPMNPERHWGPKKAATGHKRKAEDEPER